MEMLLTYLRETRTTPKAFAKLIGVDAVRFDQMLAGTARIDAPVAQRMVDATGGALLMQELVDQSAAAATTVLDMRARFAADADIDAGRLETILVEILPSLIGGLRRMGDDQLPALAAEAAVHTYAALSTVTSRRGADRLIQALRPVFAEILEEFGAPPPARARLDAAARRAVGLYFQAQPKKRPA